MAVLGDSSYYLAAIVCRTHPCQSLEILAEETFVGEVERIGDFYHGLRGMVQHHLGVHNDGPFYPYPGSDA